MIPGPIILPRLMPRDGAADRIARIVKALPMDVAIRLEFHEHKPRRSAAQNRALWGCIYPSILKAGGESLAGWQDGDLHEYLLGECFGWETVEGFGKKRIRPIRRSSKLGKLEFMEYIAFIQQRMAEHGIFVPDPDPNWFEHEAEA